MENPPASIQPTGLARSKLLTLPREIRLEILRYCLLTSRNRSTRWIISSISTEHYNRRVQKTVTGNPYVTNPICGKPTSPDHGLAVEKIDYQLYLSLLGCCRQLLHEGRCVLYNENRWLAVRWDGIAKMGRDEPYDIFRRAGLRTKWTIDSKLYGRLLGRFKSEKEYGEEHMPDMIFSVKTWGNRHEVRLIPFSELELVVRAFYITFYPPDLDFCSRPGIGIRLGLPLTRGKSQTEQVLFRTLLWLGPLVTSVRLGSTCAGKIPRDCDLASTADRICYFLHIAPTRRAYDQCLSLAKALDQVKAFRVQDIGRSVVARKLFLILGRATDAIPAYEHLPLQGPGGGCLRFLYWNSYIRRSAAWQLATLDQSWFTYIDDTEYNSVLASRRHRLLLVHFVKKLIAPSTLPPEDRRWLMQVQLRTAELHASLGKWSQAWPYLLQAVLTSPERAVVGQLSDPVATNWAMQQLMATYKRVCGDDEGLTDFVFACIRSASHDDFHKVLWAWADPDDTWKVVGVRHEPSWIP